MKIVTTMIISFIAVLIVSQSAWAGEGDSPYDSWWQDNGAHFEGDVPAEEGCTVNWNHTEYHIASNGDGHMSIIQYRGLWVIGIPNPVIHREFNMNNLDTEGKEYLRTLRYMQGFHKPDLICTERDGNVAIEQVAYTKLDGSICLKKTIAVFQSGCKSDSNSIFLEAACPAGFKEPTSPREFTPPEYDSPFLKKIECNCDKKENKCVGSQCYPKGNQMCVKGADLKVNCLPGKICFTDHNPNFPANNGYYEHVCAYNNGYFLQKKPHYCYKKFVPLHPSLANESDLKRMRQGELVRDECAGDAGDAYCSRLECTFDENGQCNPS